MGGMKMEGVLPESARNELRHQLERGGLHQIGSQIASIDTEQATAFRKYDEDKIKSEIKRTVGFGAVNAIVKGCLCESMGHAFADVLKYSSYDQKVVARI